MSKEIGRHTLAFSCTTDDLLEGLKKQVASVKAHLSHWEKKRDDLKKLLKRDGIEFTENNDGWNFTHFRISETTSVQVKNVLKDDFDGAENNVRWYARSLKMYLPWIECVKANPDKIYDLNFDDWKFFFYVEEHPSKVVTPKTAKKPSPAKKAPVHTKPKSVKVKASEPRKEPNPAVATPEQKKILAKTVEVNKPGSGK